MALILLAAGAMLNVAVAWGLAIAMPMDDTRVYIDIEPQTSWQPLADLGHPHDGFAQIKQWNRIGSTLLDISVGDFHHWPETEPHGHPIQACPAWARPWLLHAIAQRWQKVESMESRGWPCRALWCIPGEGKGYGMDPPEGGILVPDWAAVSGNRFLQPTLPLRPIWPGFAINTLFYAAVLWMVFAAPFALRRMIRRRRGQCQRCAYPIGSSPVCTECGAAHAFHAQASSPRRGAGM